MARAKDEKAIMAEAGKKWDAASKEQRIKWCKATGSFTDYADDAWKDIGGSTADALAEEITGKQVWGMAAVTRADRIALAAVERVGLAGDYEEGRDDQADAALAQQITELGRKLVELTDKAERLNLFGGPKTSKTEKALAILESMIH